MNTSPPSRVICTLFDHRYLPRGLCMINSVRRFGWENDLWVLCLNSECETVLAKLALQGVRLLSPGTLEEHIPELREAKKDRDLLDYYFTCMAALHTYLHDTIPDVDCTMYVDADMQFFDSPDIVFNAIGDAPVAIIPHNFPAGQRDRERYGVYNAGWTAFRRTAEGRICLKWWLERSLEWCHNWLDEGRYANQKYLDHFTQIAPHTKVLAHKGFNCAPWNIANYTLHESAGRIFVDEYPLIFFHFHSMKKLLRCLYFDSHRDYDTLLTRFQRNKLYRPYVRELIAMEILLSRILPVADREKLSSSPPRLLPGRQQFIDMLSGRALLTVGKNVW